MAEVIDIAVIGSGPAGMSAAVNAVSRGKSVSLFSGGSTYLQKAEQIDNYLGFWEISGAEMMERFKSHCLAKGVEPKKGHVLNILPMGESFMLNVDGEILQAKTVVLATGVVSQKHIEGEDALLGMGVSYCATCDGMLYRGRKAAVYGLSEEAPEEANFLSSIGVQVVYIAHGERPQGLDEKIEFLSGKVTKITGEQSVSSIEVGGKALPVDVVFILRETIALSNLIDGLAVEGGFVVVDKQQQTNIPGVFAAGDCTGRPLQVSKAVGEGLVAAQQAAKYIDKK